MAAVSPDAFLARYPAFSGVPVAQVEAQLEDAGDLLEPAAFTNEVSYRKAVMLMAAHHLVLGGLGATAEAQIAAQGFALDAIQSVSDSGVSVNLRAAPQGRTSAYDSTSYGRELVKLLRASVRSGIVGNRPNPNQETLVIGAWFSSEER